MDFIPRDMVPPLLIIVLLTLAIVAVWPSDITVRKIEVKPPPGEKDEEDEEPPPHDGMAAS